MFQRLLLRIWVLYLLWLLFVSGIHCGPSPQKHIIQRQDIRDYLKFSWTPDSTIQILEGNADVYTKPLQLVKGKYSMLFRAEGSIANNELPYFVVSIGKYQVKELDIKEKVNSYTINFELPETMNEPLRFTFDNDYHDSVSDRNILLHYPIVIKPF